ncbi:MAG: GNAT family N-acetyltransferase [Candidatus Dormibacteria bacterium]
MRTRVLSDAPRLLVYMVDNRDFLARYNPTPPDQAFTLPFWEERVRRDRLNQRADRAYSFLAFLRDDPDRVVGMVNLSRVVRGAFHCAGLGFSGHHAHEGRGLIREAVAAVITEAFSGLNFHRVEAAHLPDNQRSAKLLHNLGFTTEGRARDYLMIDGRWQDHVLTSITNPAWRPRP